MAKTRKKWEDGQRPSEIAEDEAWRLVNQSGLLSTIPKVPETAEKEEEPISLAEEILNTAMVIIPFCSLLLLMEILVHYQYGQDPTFSALMDRMLPGIPILSLFIFYTHRHKRDRRVQFLLFLLATTAGPRMVWLVNRASYMVNMKQCPPVATLWVYAIVQLDLGPAVMSLLAVGAWGWYSGMKVIP